jgi:hypothetical protein
MVARTTSLFTLVTTSASLQRNSAGMTSAVVLPAWVGPTMSNELRRSSVTDGPNAMPFQ